SEGVFVFHNRKMPYSCGLWRFANAYKLLYLKGDTKGGTAGNVQTLPIYLLEQYHF
ncbi:hypothetical protein GPK80_06530, partial [Coprococcus comes]|nr:hypothetical protein [Coprococcus comes]